MKFNLTNLTLRNLQNKVNKEQETNSLSTYNEVFDKIMNSFNPDKELVYSFCQTYTGIIDISIDYKKFDELSSKIKINLNKDLNEDDCFNIIVNNS